MKEVFMQAGVLQVIGRHLLLALDLDAQVKPYSTGHGRLVRSLFCFIFGTNRYDKLRYDTSTFDGRYITRIYDRNTSAIS